MGINVLTLSIGPYFARFNSGIYNLAVYCKSAEEDWNRTKKSPEIHEQCLLLNMTIDNHEH